VYGMHEDKRITRRLVNAPRTRPFRALNNIHFQ